MIRRPTTPRAIVAALASASLLAPAVLSATAAEARTLPRRACDFDWQRGDWHVKQLIRCAAHRWPVPGGGYKAISVADCESDLDPGAYNSGGYAGLFQQSTRSWSPRARAYGQPNRSVYDGQANIIVSIRMAHAARSWGDWAGCA